jgi:transcription factor TFIIIB component B''
MCLCLVTRLATPPQTRYINSMTYAKRRNNDRWTSVETSRFYHALACFGTDFTAIAKLFPGRDRCVV